MSNDHQLLPVGGTLAYTWDFSEEIPDTSPLTTITGIVVSADTGISVGSQTDDLPNGRTTVLLSGAAHARVYVAQALATLSNGEVIPKDATFQGFDC